MVVEVELGGSCREIKHPKGSDGMPAAELLPDGKVDLLLSSIRVCIATRI
jgi:hypothetical protein